ncbi:MAG: stage II sporulation protein M [Thaumarchaeota archaeon]|nr:stage II sporulation protein M [Nitrososphaerota archaeon]MDE1866173.1 stage II sporulation protein M [Nitrososphaerota archaeon]
MLVKKRLLIFLIFIVIFSIAYSAGSASNLSEDDSKSFIKEFQHVVEGIDAIGIFTHNTSVALPMFVPGFGIIWGSFAAWSTGLAFKALVSTTPTLAKLPPLAIIYLSPFGVMELIAYSIGMSRSFLLINTILRRGSLKKELRPTAIEIGIVIALLLAAAFIEYAMIQEFGSTLTQSKTH